MTKDEALKLALDFCVFCWRDVDMNDHAFGRLEQTIDTLRAAIAPPDQEYDRGFSNGWDKCAARQVTQPEEQQSCDKQEPVAWGFQNSAITGRNRWMMLREDIPTNDQYGGALWTPLYTTPPQRQPLTADQLFANDDLMALNATHAMQMSDITKIVRVIEAAHGIGDNA